MADSTGPDQLAAAKPAALLPLLLAAVLVVVALESRVFEGVCAWGRVWK